MQEFTYNVKCVLSYDGGSYFGFQAQKDLNTIEKALVHAITFITKEDNKIIGSGRTDKGVHALGQVFNFYTNFKDNETHFKYVINRMLPSDIKVLELEYVPNDFHSRFNAIKKEYRYYIKFKNYTPFDVRYFHFNDKLDPNKMADALKLFEGSHNFEGFCSAEVDKRKDFNKTIYQASLVKHEDYYEFIFVGTGFLKYQIRRMMSYIIAIGEGKLDKNIINEIYENKDHQMKYKMAPGCGLYLYKVSY